MKCDIENKEQRLPVDQMRFSGLSVEFPLRNHVLSDVIPELK
jgi:hypothetical protein